MRRVDNGFGSSGQDEGWSRVELACIFTLLIVINFNYIDNKIKFLSRWVDFGTNNNFIVLIIK